MSKPVWGQTRFQCQCGATFEAGATAILHAFDGHEVVQEKFAQGRWLFLTRVPIMEMIIERLRARGESLSGFTRRLNERREQLEREEQLLDAAGR